jgi:hypothetical protein
LRENQAGIGRNLCSVLAPLNLAKDRSASQDTTENRAFFVDVTYYPFGDSGKHDDAAVILGADYRRWSSRGLREKSTTAQSTVMRIIRLSLEDPAKFNELNGEDQSDVDTIANVVRRLAKKRMWW